MHTEKAEPPIRWKRENLEWWRARQSIARRKEDRAQLAELFKLADDIPVLKDALSWARRHGIEFIMDATTKAAGYYYTGTGVIGLSKQYINDKRYLAGVLAHEIRHAWQDYYRMIPTGGKTFANYFIREALIEADATAHQNLAVRQYDIASEIRFLKSKHALAMWEATPAGNRQKIANLKEEMTATQFDPRYLWDGFEDWYYEWKPAVYGDAAMRRFAVVLGIPNVKIKNSKYEYSPNKGPRDAVEEGIDTLDESALRRLGKTFNGMNYFNAADRDLLTRHFLSASHAINFYDKDGWRVLLTDAIRKRQLLLRGHHGHEVLIPSF